VSSPDQVFEELDVRELQPRDRHRTITGRFDALGAGDGFILINDHDPRPLYYEFQSTRGDIFDWEYLEQGPTLWKVKVTKSGVSETSPGIKIKFDVRQIPGPDRHRTIFHRYNALESGESIEIIADHEPVHLRQQFEARNETFSWEILERGPETWRIRITKGSGAE